MAVEFRSPAWRGVLGLEGVVEFRGDLRLRTYGLGLGESKGAYRGFRD